MFKALELLNGCILTFRNIKQAFQNSIVRSHVLTRPTAILEIMAGVNKLPHCHMTAPGCLVYVTKGSKKLKSRVKFSRTFKEYVL